MSYKLDFAVTYHFGHSTCSSGPFLLKIWSKDAYLRGVHSSSSNRLEPGFIGSVQSGSSILGSLNCNWQSGFLRFSPVQLRSFSGSINRTFKHYLLRRSFIWCVLSAQRHCVTVNFIFDVIVSLKHLPYIPVTRQTAVSIPVLYRQPSQQVSIRTVYGLSVYCHPPYSVRPWPYNGQCAALTKPHIPVVIWNPIGISGIPVHSIY
jgi:hypothetical protein